MLELGSQDQFSGVNIQDLNLLPEIGKGLSSFIAPENPVRR
jgi:hypothetical protein